MPLTGDLDFSDSQFSLKCKLPTQNSDASNKYYVDQQVFAAGGYKDKIVSVSDQNTYVSVTSDGMEVVDSFSAIMTASNNNGVRIWTQAEYAREFDE